MNARTTQGRRPARTTVAALAAALVVTAGGCSADDGGDGAEPSSPPATTGTPTAAPEPATTARFGRVAGSRISRVTRERLRRQVVPVVDAWFDGAYVGGTWPRAGVGGAFAGFTVGARREVRRDLRVMTNVAIGERITGVAVRRRVVALDVLAVKRRPVAVTARVSLAFRTTGDVERVRTIRGRLFLTRAGGHDWKVFGYDVSAGGRPVGERSAR